MQEYDHEQPHPDTRGTYLSYLDSIKYFRPAELRTAVCVHARDKQMPPPRLRRMRTCVRPGTDRARYHEFVIAYMDWVKRLGCARSWRYVIPYALLPFAFGYPVCGRRYNYLMLWACPPLRGDDYIFYCHPDEQRTPKPEMLRDWYGICASCIRRAVGM